MGQSESLTESSTFGVSTASAKPRLTTLQLPEGNNSGRISALKIKEMRIFLNHGWNRDKHLFIAPC